MKQTTLFGTATSTTITTPTRTTAINGNKIINTSPQSPKIALSNYFKSSHQINFNSHVHAQIPEANILQQSECRSLSTSKVMVSPVSKIAENISIISIESPIGSSKSPTKTAPLNQTTLGINTNQVNTVTESNANKSTVKNGNQITSHFFPKKLSSLDAFNLSFDEDEKSLKKTKQKNLTGEIFVEGTSINFENPSYIFMLSDFFYDFHELFVIQSNDVWSPPNFHVLCQALQSCVPTENFPILAPLLVRLISYLFKEPLTYFNESIDNLNTVYNASAVLWLYFYQNMNSELLKTLQTDFYCLPCDLKIFIFNILLEDVLNESRFRSFYEEKLTLIEDTRKNFKRLKSDLYNLNREKSALKLYRSEKTDLNDKENVNYNSNHQPNEVDIDTRLQQVSYNINHLQREISKVESILDRNESFSISRKKLGTDSYGRNYYRLKSYSETAVLVEMDKSKKEFFEKLESERNEALSTTKQIENVNETTEQNKNKLCLNLQETDSKELQKNFTKVTSKINAPISPTISEETFGTISVVWMDYTTEIQLKDLIKYLKTDVGGKKFYIRIEEILSSLINGSNEEKVSCDEEASHFLRSMRKDKASPVEFTCKEFASQLTDLGEDLLSSGLVSTRFDYITWIDTLTNGNYSLTTESCLELTEKLTYLMESLVDSCKINIHSSIHKSYLPQTTPTLSRLFLLLDYYERTIDTSDSCYRKTCRECMKKNIWNGTKYNPLFTCKDCFKTIHLTCQDPPLKDIKFDHSCNQCTSPQTLTINTFYRTNILPASEDESSSDTEESIPRRRLRHITTYPASNSSPPSYYKLEKKRRVVSSGSEEESPNPRRMGLRSMAYQPPKKKLTYQTTGYASKLRSACT